MPRLPLLTVAIPSFNYGQYLGRCIRSVTELTGDDIEILVADNASCDDSWDVISAFSDPRIKAWRHASNIGLYPNWNFLLTKAQGTFFKLLQSDDWLEPAFGVRFRACLEGEDPEAIAAVLLGHWVCDERTAPEQERAAGAILPEQSGIPESFSIGDSFEPVVESLAFSMPTLNVMSSRLLKSVNGYQPEDGMRSDTIAFARVLAAGRSMLVKSCNHPVAVTRVHGRNDRYRYSRFATSRDEVLYLTELRNLASGDALAKLEKSISIAKGSALIRLFVDLAWSRRGRQFMQGIRWFGARDMLGEAFWAAAPAAFEIAKTRSGRSRLGR